MPKQQPKWKGSRGIFLQPGYPAFYARGDSEGYRFAYRGPYKTLLASKPIRGTKVEGWGNYYVEEVDVKPDGAGQDGPGTLTFSTASVVAGGTANPEDETKVSIESGRMEKSIYSCPAYADIPEAEITRIREAFESNKPIPIFADIGATWITAAYRLFEYLNRGQDSYVLAAPTVTFVTYSYTQPITLRTGRGTRTTEKPHPSAPDGYQWLCTVCDINQDGGRGKWQRIVKWEAADEWAPFTYDIPE